MRTCNYRNWRNQNVLLAVWAAIGGISRFVDFDVIGINHHMFKSMAQGIV